MGQRTIYSSPAWWVNELVSLRASFREHWLGWHSCSFSTEVTTSLWLNSFLSGNGRRVLPAGMQITVCRKVGSCGVPPIYMFFFSHKAVLHSPHLALGLGEWGRSVWNCSLGIQPGNVLWNGMCEQNGFALARFQRPISATVAYVPFTHPGVGTQPYTTTTIPSAHKFLFSAKFSVLSHWQCTTPS